MRKVAPRADAETAEEEDGVVVDMMVSLATSLLACSSFFQSFSSAPHHDTRRQKIDKDRDVYCAPFHARPELPRQDFSFWPKKFNAKCVAAFW